ncbi:MAG: uroporphyrinogen decarboxylase family protein [Kiritimatiellae bacterium]|nr:uroporphyrinogen decarboxylase family protein [Kiritimatiellia bacterium]
MTSREIIKRNLSSGNASRFGMNFGGGRQEDFVGAGPSASAIWTKKTWTEGVTEFSTDEWGNTWHRLVGMSAGGEIFKPALQDWNQLKDWRLPDFGEAKRYASVQTAFESWPDKFHMGCLPGFPFAISRYLRKMEIYFQDLILEREHIDELHDKVTGLLEKMIRQFSAAGADGVFFCEDWGIQDRLLIHPDMWREIFKPLYRRLCDAAHKAGIQVLMHSCGYNWAILDDLAEVGINAFQFDQPEIYGIERLAAKLKPLGVCLWSPVDIQKIMPTGNRELIEKTAERMVELFFNQNGRFIAKNYGDLKGIGVKPEWDLWAYARFAALAKIDVPG